MSDTNNRLNIVGLLSLANDFISANAEHTKACEEYHAAQAKTEQAIKSLEEIRKKFGRHTAVSGRDEMIMVNDDQVLHVPTPAAGYNDTTVYPFLHTVTRAK